MNFLCKQLSQFNLKVKFALLCSWRGMLLLVLAQVLAQRQQCSTEVSLAKAPWPWCLSMYGLSMCSVVPYCSVHLLTKRCQSLSMLMCQLTAGSLLNPVGHCLSSYLVKRKLPRSDVAMHSNSASLHIAVATRTPVQGMVK